MQVVTTAINHRNVKLIPGRVYQVSNPGSVKTVLATETPGYETIIGVNVETGMVILKHENCPYTGAEEELESTFLLLDGIHYAISPECGYEVSLHTIATGDTFEHDRCYYINSHVGPIDIETGKLNDVLLVNQNTPVTPILIKLVLSRA